MSNTGCATCHQPPQSCICSALAVQHQISANIARDQLAQQGLLSQQNALAQQGLAGQAMLQGVAVGWDDPRRERDQLRARVAELEAANAKLEAILVDRGDVMHRQQASVLALQKMVDAKRAPIEEDLSRKRDECVRLEQACGDLRACVQRYKERWEDACKDLADARRELRGRR